MVEQSDKHFDSLPPFEATHAHTVLQADAALVALLLEPVDPLVPALQWARPSKRPTAAAEAMVMRRSEAMAVWTVMQGRHARSGPRSFFVISGAGAAPATRVRRRMARPRRRAVALPLLAPFG
jgi:hypothetical protein